MKADLHVHTDISDGFNNLTETINFAKTSGVTHLAITNHDTTRGIEDAIIEGQKENITVIPGIEISSQDIKSGKKVHILGYYFDLKGINIKKLCDPILERRNANSQQQLESIIRAGFKIDVERLYERSKKSRVIYKQHMMAELTHEDYMSEKYKSLYKSLFKGQGVCARDIQYVDMLEAVKAIKADNGLAILAHPGQLDSYGFIEALVKAGLDGIELNHEDHSVDDIIKIRKYSDKYKLFLTGGSDFHGQYGTPIKIGDIECPSEYHYIFKGSVRNGD